MKKPNSNNQTISVVIPVKDERDSLETLVQEITDTCHSSKILLKEIVFVDDGSLDDSWQIIRKLAKKDKRIKGLKFRRNFGKATALTYGALETTSSIIITMDGDLQDSPKEIPRFLTKLDEGYDLVSGWKEKRHDPLDKTLPSRLFNKATAKVTGIDLHDFNCGFKAYRRQILEDIELYGELHRFIPVLADSYGYKIGEISVEHRARQYGVSKYGAGRLVKGMLDLFTVVTLTRYSRRPSHLFGSLGLIMLTFGTLFLVYLTLLKLFTGADIGDRPLLILGVLLEILGVQFVLFGLLAELLTNFAAKITDKPNLVSEKIGSNKT